MNPQDIRAIQFIDSFFPVTDGVVQTVHNYASIMNQRGYGAVVAPLPRQAFDDSALPYPVLRTKKLPLPLREYSFALPGADLSLKHFLHHSAPSVFHAHSPFAEGQFAAHFARKLAIPCVSTFHSKYYDDILQNTGSPALAKAVVKNIVHHYNSVNSVWTCSGRTAETLRSYGYRGDIFVMDNGSSLWYSEAEAAALAARARAAFHLPQGKRVLLFVGHLIWQKNLKLVLDTLRLLADESDDYALVIAGEGYRQEEIQQYAHSLALRPRFTGIINDRALLAGLYAASDLFFFPSVYDNSPLVVREAASLGLPSLLVEGSNAAEIVTPNVSGFTAANDAAAMAAQINRIFATPGLLPAVARQARLSIPKSWESIVSQVQEKYLEIIDSFQFNQRCWVPKPPMSGDIFRQ